MNDEPGLYRPWPLTVLALALAAGAALYLFDFTLLAGAGRLRPIVAILFLAGATFAAGLAWGIWRLQEWSRQVVIWLCILSLAGLLFILPFVLIGSFHAGRIDIWDIAIALLLAAVGAGVIRYLGRPSTRERFLGPAGAPKP